MTAGTAAGLALALAAGGALGTAYLLGLWATVRRLSATRFPALLSLGSLLARLVLLLGGVYLVADGQWPRVAAALAGFLLARTVLIRRLGPAGTGRQTP